MEEIQSIVVLTVVLYTHNELSLGVCVFMDLRLIFCLSSLK